ncbi:hypothetical protein TIFTF001_024455 [Ficus carica]|uniref:Uncharacterized protein n=1 Tax=Ficus carica TaxID=3494 RepID=A0AA88ALE6_FICCA|nr:hypothetical protein TIFTF001_024455 [Ficus carica]
MLKIGMTFRRAQFISISGIVEVHTSTGFVIPAKFNDTSRCPDELVRRIRVTASYEDRRWDGKLLETYDTQTDTFNIAPCRWTEQQVRIARYLKDASDSYILHNCSTSPLAEGPEKWQYLIANPNWKETFPMEKPRVWERTEDGCWSSASSQNRTVEVGKEELDPRTSLLSKSTSVRTSEMLMLMSRSNQPQRASDNRHGMRTGQKSFIERITSGHKFCKTASFMEKLDHQPGVNNGRAGRSRSTGVERGRLGVGGSH